ncbi:MAG TPA: PQQ-binding-like beta-propeller repeat protein [Tepidisphaeraceae bacterium]|jgi:outer membrane protein assembly factor BamB|nr:PQQ-binding-like beta-propeller repeat protein [Tepidisphaeraceae bacterium]
MRRCSFLFGLSLFALHLLAAGVRGDDWPAWRGADGQGVAHETNFPETWSAKENVVWRTPLPGPCNSTPIVCKGRVFVTQATDNGAKRLVLCFDRATGKSLWQGETAFAGKERTEVNTNPYCSASPVTDGQRVVAWLGSAGMVAYDLDGKLLWRADLGEFEHPFGNGSSPLIFGDAVIVNCGPGANSFLVALDKRDGKQLWKHDFLERQKKQIDEWSGAWDTPIVIQVDGKQQIVVALPKRVAAFDPASGDEIWTCSGMNDSINPSPLFAQGIVVATGANGGPTMAIRVGGAKGDVTKTNRLWVGVANGQRVSSGVIAGGHLFLVNELGVAQCITLATGKEVWKERMGKQAWGSLVLVGEKIYAIDATGETFVFDAAPVFKIREHNPLGETTRGSLAFSDGQIFVRTYKALYCIGAKK